MKRILKSGTGEVVEKKSRFIAVALDVSSGEDAIEKVNTIRKKYYDARHNCYAYICGEDAADRRFSDDGEPSGTAGKPMMDILDGSGITNCLIVVTRYFGGTLLGTGGLVKAYSAAAKLALENAVTTEVITGTRCQLSADYNSLGKLQYIFSTNETTVLDTTYDAGVILEFITPTVNLPHLIKLVTDEFAGKLTIEEQSQVQYYVKDGAAVVL